MLSARELDLERNPGATGFVNQRIIFTHGIGVAMVPVNEVASEGQPRLFIRNLPPVSSRRRPRDHRAADLLRRAADATTSSPAPGRPSSTTRPATATPPARRRDGDALDRHDRHPARHDPHAAAVRAPLPRPRPAHQRPGHRPTASSCSTARSRDRLPRIAPFLRYDKDPYLVIDGDGRLVVRPGRLHDDATASRTPSLRPARRSRRRASAAALQLHPQQRQGRVDAYDGTMTLLRRRPGRPDHPRLAGRLPDPVPAAGELPADLAAAPPRPGGAVQRPDADVRPLPRHEPARRSSRATTCGRSRRPERASRACRPRPTT